MQQLKELLEVVGNRPILAPDNIQGKQALKLARWLRKHAQPTDEAARKALGYTQKKSAFRKVKYHLRIFLLNSITSVSTQTVNNDLSRLEINRSTWHQLAAVKSAPGLFNKFQGKRILNSIIAQATDSDLKDQLVIGEISNLAGDYSSKSQQDSYGRVRNTLYRGYASSITRQQHSLTVYMNKMRVPAKEKIQVLKTCIAELDRVNLLEDEDATLKSLYLQIKVSLFENDLERAKRVHDQAMIILDQQTPQKPFKKLNFKANLIRYYIRAENPLEGISIVEEALQLTSNSPYHQYLVLELGLLLTMKGGDYQLAYEYYQELIANSRYNELEESQKETILIMYAYLALLHSANEVQISDPEFSKFRIHKFLNSLNASLKEKSLRNTHAVIIRILDHCINKREQDFDLAESTKKYVQRHLSAPESYRTKNFLLALIQYPENGYDLYFTMKKASKYLSRINGKTTSTEFGEHSYMEIIPYAILWDIVTNFTPNR